MYTRKVASLPRVGVCVWMRMYTRKVVGERMSWGLRGEDSERDIYEYE
jgi:hypothetical protein